MIEQFAIGLRRAHAGPRRRDGIAADEAVDIFERRILARIDHRAAAARHRHPGAFMRGAAERGAFDRRRGRVHRIDLDDPAEAVGFVGMANRIEALVEFGPAVPALLRQAPAPLVRIGRVAGIEIAVEVFLARQVGAPRRLAAGAVVQRAEHSDTCRIGGGAQQPMARRRPAHPARRAGGDAARMRRRPDHLPAARADRPRPRSPRCRARPAIWPPSRPTSWPMPSGCSRPSSAYSWFITSRPRREPSSGK